MEVNTFICGTRIHGCKTCCRKYIRYNRM